MSEHEDDSPYVLGDGTFGIVTKIDDNTVQKKYNKYEDDTNSFNPCGIKELIILSQFKGLDVIELKSFCLTENNVCINLEDGGVSLFDYVMLMEKVDEAPAALIDLKEYEPNCETDNYEYCSLNTDTYLDRLRDLPSILAKVIPSIYFIHLNGIIHNDMKPDNILLRGTDSKIKLIDFSASTLEGAHYSKCNNNFRAPETFFDGTITTSSDIWGLGMTCLFFVLNSLICDRIGQNIEDEHICKYYKFQKSKTEYLHFDESKFQSNLPLLNLIKRMLIFDPRKRITAAELFLDPMFYHHQIENQIVRLEFDDITKKYDNEFRKQLIETIYKICTSAKMKQCFSNAVWIMDTFCSKFKIVEENINKIAISCVIISSCINDTFLKIKYYKDLVKTEETDPKLIELKVKELIDPVVTDIVTSCIGRLYIKTFDKMIEIEDHEQVYKLVKSEMYFDKTHKQLCEMFG